jgi:hypothetical protein
MSKEPIDLDALHSEVKKLDALLSDRQPGLMSWYAFFLERLRIIRQLIG